MDKEQIESISLHMSSFSVDPVNKFKARNFFEDDQDDEIELSLGLSLNGKFGIDPKAKKLKRAASIPEFVDPSRLEEKARVVQMSGLGGGTLARTCSLPTEAEEEVRKRKEVQMLRRMEAKRKRNEKQRNLKLSREKSCEIVVNGGDGNGNSICSGLQQGKQSSGLPGWVCAAKGGCGNGLEGKPPVAPPLSQGSVGSQGTGSSGVTESDSHFSRGLNRHAEARSPASIQSLPDNEHKRTVACGEVVEKSGKSIGNFPMDNTSSNSKCDKELFTTLFRTMPCVSTQGDGPDGKRIEGFLYRYKKGEAVMIVCVCHGSFLTPAEFVKHAGGTDVTHPLRHIVVNPAPLL